MSKDDLVGEGQSPDSPGRWGGSLPAGRRVAGTGCRQSPPSPAGPCCPGPGEQGNERDAGNDIVNIESTSTSAI